MPKVYITPQHAQDGIIRVLDALHRYLPDYGWQVVDNPEEADLVNGHVMMADGRTGKPFVHSNHGLYWHGFDWPTDFLRANQVIIDNMAQSQAITCPSHWVKHALSRGMLRRIDVIHHGVDPEKFKPQENSGFVLWNKGRRDPVSNPDEMNQLAELLPATPFVSTLGKPSNNVQIIGRIGHEQMPNLVASAGVYLATARETFGIGTLEALASGVPVAGWAHGGQLEIVRQGETGYLAPYGDYEALAECIDLCFANRPKLSELARLDVLERWLWPDKVAQYAAVFDRVLEEWNRPRPKVTIIVTCHNLARYLPDALDSIQSQTLTDFECLIVDDFSTDETPEISKQYESDSRFKYLPTPENLKLSGARNYGFKHATGWYILNLDADDILDKNCLETLSLALDHNHHIHIAYGHLDVISEDGQERRRNDWPVQFNWFQQMAHLNQLPYCSMMRWEVWEQSGGYRIRDYRAEDASLWCRVTSFGFRAAKVTEESLLLYRLRSDSKGSKEREVLHDNDGDWTGWYSWRLGAATPQQGMALLQKGTAVSPLKVPFGAQEPQSGDIAWPIHSHHDPVISVIVPVGPGHDKYLMDVADCMLAQSYPYWELVIVNNTGKEIDLSFAPFARLVDQPLRGIAHARNKGLEAAKSPLVLFLDADDLLLPDTLEKMLRAWIDNGGGKYIFGDWYAVTHEGKIEHKKSKPDNQREWKVNHPISILMNREHALAVGGFDSEIKGWEDWDFFIKLRINGFCPTHLPEPTIIYRTHAGKRREQSLQDANDILPVLKQRYDDYYNGKRNMTMCCGGNGDVIMQAKNSLKGLTGVQQTMSSRNGIVRMMYIGNNKGSITFRKPGLSKDYRGGNNAIDRYADVQAADVPILEATGKWKIAKAESGIDLTQAAVPQPEPEVFTPQPVKRQLKSPDDMTVAQAKEYAIGLGVESLGEFITLEQNGQNRVTLVSFLEKLRTDVVRVN